MSAISKFDFQERKQLRFSEVNYLNYTHKKDPILHAATTFFLKQGETRTSHGPIPHPLSYESIQYFAYFDTNELLNGSQLAKMKKSIPHMSLP